jgi:hypothetical protein
MYMERVRVRQQDLTARTNRDETRGITGGLALQDAETPTPLLLEVVMILVL